MLLPALRPLWLALAAALPDAAQRRHMEARQAVADVSRRLMREWQQQVRSGLCAAGLQQQVWSGLCVYGWVAARGGHGWLVWMGAGGGA